MNWKDAKKQSETAFPLLAPSRVAGIAAIGDVVIISCFEADVAVVLYDDDLSKAATAIAIVDARKQVAIFQYHRQYRQERREGGKNMNMNYTPGPWAFKDDFDLVVGPVGTDISREPVALIPGTDCDAFGNARLIAAAPELLEALQLLVEGHSMRDESIGRAAIAKALGTA